jgi:tripartite-type tricarboxylate transporter receptor subunit TctC
MSKILGIILFVFAMSATAKETVTIIYGFSAADNAANYSRTLAEEANRIQNKYTFVFDVRPGGGQTVAVNYIHNAPNTVFMTAGSFWLRPALYPNPSESWNINDWHLLMTQCAAPFGVASVKYKSWKEVPTDQRLTVAIAGLGTYTHIIALQLFKNYPNMEFIPYKSTADGMLATVSGQIDFVIGFLGDQKNWTHSGSQIKLNILGTTGKGAGGYPSLVSQGFPEVLTKLDTTHNLMVPNTFGTAKTKEIRDILVRAEKSKIVRDSYAIDYCTPVTIPENKLDDWFNDQNKTMSSLAKGIKLEK